MKQQIKNLKKAIIGFMALGALGYVTGCSSNGGGEAQALAEIEQGVVAEAPVAPIVNPTEPTTPPVDANPADPTNPANPIDPNNPNDPTNPPPPPPPPATPVTCYQYGFVSSRDNGAENVFFTDTCKDLDDTSRVSFGAGLIRPVIDVGNRFDGRFTPSNGPRRLTNNGNTDRYFGDIAFTADGAQMVYGQARFSDPVFNPTTLLGDPNGGSAFTALDEALGLNSTPDPRAVDFRSNGTDIAYIQPRDQNFCDVNLDTGDCTPLTLRLFHIVVKDPINGNHDVVNAENEDHIFEKVVFHPTANKLFYSSKKGSDPFLMRIFFVGAGSADLIERIQSGIPLPLKGFQPSIKPNGSQLAFIREINGRNQVFRCTFRTRQNAANQPISTCEDVEQLTHIGTNTQPSYTPDGQFIFYTSDRDGHFAIYKMKADGSEETRLTPAGVSYRSAVVHPITITQ